MMETAGRPSNVQMSAPLVNPQAHVGDVIAGKYRVDRVLGEGGMGVVVAATHEQLGQRVALKFLLPTMASRPDLVQRFIREARAAVQIQSEHVARVFDVGTHNNIPFMVMEYLEGSDLSHVILTRPLSIRESVGYVLEACDAVAEAHSLGIVHRDLKPANMFLANRPSGKPIVKVLDFGISKSPTTGNDAAITNPSSIMGSPSYMSPEQMVASASVDVRADVWSLGVVLYEMLAQRLPFAADSMPELVGAILQGNFPPLASMRDLGMEPGGVEIQAVIDRCLQKERGRRFQNVAELARALAPFGPSRSEALVERIESTLGLSSGVPSSQAPRALSAPSVRSTGPGPASPASMTLSPTTTVPPPRRSPLLVIAPLLVLLCAALALGAIMLKRSKETVVQPPTSLAATTGANTSSAVASLVPPIIVPDPTPTSLEMDVVPSSAPAHSRPHASAHASASAAPSASARCPTVTFFDTSGVKHFKLECPP